MSTNNPDLSLVDFRLGSFNDMGINDKVAYLEEQIGGGTSDVYNVVTAYGAVGDGVTDDTLAFQDAIDACNAAGGGTVFIPNGTYLISSVNTGVVGWAGCIKLQSNVRLQGESRAGVILKLDADQPVFTRLLIADGATDATVETLTIDGNRTNQAFAEEHMSGIFVGNTSRLKVQDCTLINCVGDGLSIWASNEDTLVYDVYINNCGRSGASMTGGLQARVTFRSCQFVENAVQQIDMEAPDGPFEDVVIDGCYFVSTEGAAEAIALRGRPGGEQAGPGHHVLEQRRGRHHPRSLGGRPPLRRQQVHHSHRRHRGTLCGRRHLRAAGGRRQHVRRQPNR
jgi:hypothetical protein